MQTEMNCNKCGGNSFVGKLLRVRENGKEKKSSSWLCASCHEEYRKPDSRKSYMERKKEEIEKANEKWMNSPPKKMNGKNHPWKTPHSNFAYMERNQNDI